MISAKEQLLRELEEVIKAVQGIKKVSHGKPLALSNEQVFPAVYLCPQITTYKNRTNTKCKGGYYEIFPINVLVNTNNDNDLDYLQVEEDIIKAVLDDTRIWSVLVDRELVTVGYDGYESYPKREFIIQFEFKLKSSC